jgi:hypothetical protein
MGVWEKLGESIGKLFNAYMAMQKKSWEAFFSIVKVWVGWNPSVLKDMDNEIAAKSIDPDMFRSKEFKDFAVDLKKKLGGSPDSLIEWMKTSYLSAMGMLYDGMIDLLIPLSPKDFATAKENAGHVTMLAADFIVLTAVLDIAATALSATLVRNIIHVGRMFISTFGLDRYVSAVIAPALVPGLTTPLSQGWNEQFQTNIPPIQDVIRFTVREVYDPARRAELLSVPTPSEAYRFARKHGFSDSVMDDYWAAHWVLPSIGDLNTMLQRNVITPETWSRYITLNDYEPMMIDNFKKIIYSPYARVDIRRMYNSGVLDEAGVKRGYLDIGYDDEKATKLTEFTKALKTGTAKDLTLSMITNAFKQGNVSRDAALEMIIDLGYEEDEADFILALYEQQTKQESRELSQSKFDVMFQLGLIDREELKRNLIALNYATDAAENLTKIEEAKKAGKISLLPLGTLREALRRKIIEPEDFAARAQRLGYQDDEIEIVIQLEGARAAA